MDTPIGERLHRINLSLEHELEPINRLLCRIESTQPMEVFLGPSGAEIHTVWSEEAAKMRDALYECREHLIRRAYEMSGLFLARA